MTRHSVVVADRAYTVNGLDPRPRGSIVQAVVAAQLLDDLTGAPVEGATVTTSVAGLRGRVASGGFVGLAGDPSRALPGLALAAYVVDLQIDAPGYAARRESVAFPVQPGFPVEFDPADLDVLPLRRLPVAVRIGSYALDPSNRPQPLAAADVTVTGHWRRLGDLGSPAATDALLGVVPGLRESRPAGATLDLPTLTTPAEPPRTLVAAAAPGATSIAVSRRGSLGPGELVGLDLTDPDRAERVELVAVDGPADPESPADLRLRFPLAHGHPEAAGVARILAVPGAAAATLVDAAMAGDRTLLVSSLAGLPAGQVVRVSGGGPPEYATTAHYELSTDSGGAGRLPPMTGVAAIAVSAVSGGLGATARVTLTQSSPAVDLTLV